MFFPRMPALPGGEEGDGIMKVTLQELERCASKTGGSNVVIVEAYRRLEEAKSLYEGVPALWAQGLDGLETAFNAFLAIGKVGNELAGEVEDFGGRVGVALCDARGLIYKAKAENVGGSVPVGHEKSIRECIHRGKADLYRMIMLASYSGAAVLYSGMIATEAVVVMSRAGFVWPSGGGASTLSIACAASEYHGTVRAAAEVFNLAFLAGVPEAWGVACGAYRTASEAAMEMCKAVKVETIGDKDKIVFYIKRMSDVVAMTSGDVFSAMCCVRDRFQEMSEVLKTVVRLKPKGPDEVDGLGMKSASRPRPTP